jgi:hypothetical protein
MVMLLKELKIRKDAEINSHGLLSSIQSLGEVQEKNMKVPGRIAGPPPTICIGEVPVLTTILDYRL